MSSSCIIATYGDKEVWNPLANRALRSARDQTEPFDEVIWVHGKTLQEARNESADMAISEWLVFLDGDDELDFHYNEAMVAGTGDIRRPATLGIVDGIEDDGPVMIPRSDMRYRNCVVIGAMIRRADFLAVGGFADLEALEDYDLWIRMIRAGARIGDVPKAIYRVNVTPVSRNQNRDAHNRAYTKICNSMSDLPSWPYVD